MAGQRNIDTNTNRHDVNDGPYGQQASQAGAALFTIRSHGFLTTFGLARDDFEDMNNNDRPTLRRASPADPMAYVSRRIVSLAVGAIAIAALLSAGFLESAGLPGPIAVGTGFVGFVVATVFVTDLVAGGRMPVRAEGPE